ncbi:GNAT family N-acetyltransferase [Marinilabilia sp.]
METDIKIIDFTPENIADYGVCGYKDVHKHKELREKIEWFSKYYPKGLRIKAVVSNEGGYQGMLEYLPGEYAHRPVNASGYMFIHCVFMGFKKEFKGKGYGSSLISACIDDARKQKLKGVAVVTRKGSFMAKPDIFLKNGFEVVDVIKPDFQLLALKFDQESEDPSFKAEMQENLKNYQEGLTILRSFQCPYTEKNVNAIVKTAREKFKLSTRLVNLEDAEAAQNNPCAFGTFCLILNGEIISYHPISNTRFENIMKQKIPSKG